MQFSAVRSHASIYCSTCLRPIDTDSEIAFWITHEDTVCGRCLTECVPKPGEVVIVVREDSKRFGHAFPVDAIDGTRVIIKTEDTYESYALPDIVRPLWRR